MKILLDTCAYSAYRRGLPKAVDMIGEADEIVLSPIVLGELNAGFMKSQRINENKVILREFISSPRVSLIKIDAETGELYALILDTLRKAGTPIPPNDIWIAASAIQYGLHLVTLDTHFKSVPQVMVEYIQL